jgi:hypothetical protein
MTQVLYDDLWHYSERFTRDKLQRSELQTMAYVQGLKMGDKCSPKLMKSVMHFRSKELNKRSAFDGKEMGKNQIDAWNKDKVFIDRPAVKGEEGQTLGDLLLRSKSTPLDYTITNDFLATLSPKEAGILEDISAGYTHKEICVTVSRSRCSTTSARLYKKKLSTTCNDGTSLTKRRRTP